MKVEPDGTVKVCLWSQKLIPSPNTTLFYVTFNDMDSVVLRDDLLESLGEYHLMINNTTYRIVHDEYESLKDFFANPDKFLIEPITPRRVYNAIMELNL